MGLFIKMSSVKKQRVEVEAKIKVVLGTMEFGRGPMEEESRELLQIFFEYGNFEKNAGEIDTAILYCGGQTEKILGSLEANKTFKVACKVNPWGKNSLSKGNLIQQFNLSLSRLKAKQVDIL